MNTTIWKYKLPLNDTGEIELPKGAEILCVQTQGGEPHLWAHVDPSAEVEKRQLMMSGTGHTRADLAGARYIGTFQMLGTLVFHVFEPVRAAR